MRLCIEVIWIMGIFRSAIYDDRLEITSPGKLPMGQTLERMKEGIFTNFIEIIVTVQIIVVIPIM